MLLDQIDVVEGSIDLARMVSSSPQTYICEVLNTDGGIATINEVEKMANINNISMVKMSDILREKRNDKIYSFSGKVIEGRKLGRQMGFPTAI